MKNEVDGRREIASRNTAWANNIARKLTRWGVTPNQISMMSVFFAMIGCLLLIGTVIYPGFNKYVAYILFIVCMQSRLLCNLGWSPLKEEKKVPTEIFITICLTALPMHCSSFPSGM